MTGPILGAVAGLVAGYVSRCLVHGWRLHRPDPLTLGLAALSAVIVSRHPLAQGQPFGPIVASVLVGVLTLIAASDIRERAVYPVLVYPAVLFAIAAAPILGIWRIDAL